MEMLNMVCTSGASLCVFDEKGSLVGTITRPVEREPLGPGRETVYLARPTRADQRPAAAA